MQSAYANSAALDAAANSQRLTLSNNGGQVSCDSSIDEVESKLSGELFFSR